MKTKKQKRDEALTRLKKATFNSSKSYRRWLKKQGTIEGSGLSLEEVAREV